MIKNYNPTSPGVRSRKSLVHNVDKVRPVKNLTVHMTGPVGRNKGSISSWHTQRGAKKHYRIVDFKRDKLDIPAKVASIEYDPFRGPNVALLNYADGEKRYILAPEGLKVGMTVLSSESAEFTVGNCLPLANIPLGSEIHNIELNPGRGGQLARGAGNKAVIMAREDKYASIKLPSGEVKKILGTCKATIGVLGNADIRNVVLGKAGRNRHMGRRPVVRGVAMANPKDHPHAGSYRDNGTGHPVTPWGKPTRGKKTRRRTHTDKFMVSPRRRGKKR